VHGFEQANGAPVLVSRGKLADGQPLPPAPTAETEVIGHLIWHDQGRGFFDVDNKPDENRWYWWDVVAMTNQFAATHLNPNYAVVHLVPGAPGTEGLVVEEVKANLRNNHLGYAITWFGLAAALLVMTAIFLYRPRHSGESRNLSDR
jgi:surfeit locus 1 family protein